MRNVWRVFFAASFCTLRECAHNHSVRSVCAPSVRGDTVISMVWRTARFADLAVFDMLEFPPISLGAEIVLSSQVRRDGRSHLHRRAVAGLVFFLLSIQIGLQFHFFIRCLHVQRRAGARGRALGIQDYIGLGGRASLSSISSALVSLT